MKSLKILIFVTLFIKTRKISTVVTETVHRRNDNAKLTLWMMQDNDVNEFRVTALVNGHRQWWETTWTSEAGCLLRMTESRQDDCAQREPFIYIVHVEHHFSNEFLSVLLNSESNHDSLKWLVTTLNVLLLRGYHDCKSNAHMNKYDF